VKNIALDVPTTSLLYVDVVYRLLVCFALAWLGLGLVCLFVCLFVYLFVIFTLYVFFLSEIVVLYFSIF
jgi:hypothetical protein